MHKGRVSGNTLKVKQSGYKHKSNSTGKYLTPAQVIEQKRKGKIGSNYKIKSGQTVKVEVEGHVHNLYNKISVCIDEKGNAVVKVKNNTSQVMHNKVTGKRSKTNATYCGDGTRPRNKK